MLDSAFSCDYVFIMAAGKGTRMGAIGEKMPKPLWPKDPHECVLGYHIEEALLLNPKQIVINTHHQALEILSYLQKHLKYAPLLQSKKIMISCEPELLDQGGGLLQFWKIVTDGSPSSPDELVFSVVSDMIPNISFSHVVKEILLKQDLTPVTLLGLKLKEDEYEKYNHLKTDHHNFLKEIVPKIEVAKNKDICADHYTFSGCSFILLSHLARLGETHANEKIRPSSFFESVANYKKNDVKVMKDLNLSFTDLGTLQQFLDHHYKSDWINNNAYQASTIPMVWDKLGQFQMIVTTFLFDQKIIWIRPPFIDARLLENNIAKNWDKIILKIQDCLLDFVNIKIGLIVYVSNDFFLVDSY